MKVSSPRGQRSSLATSKGEAKRSVEVRHGAFLEALQAAESAGMQREVGAGFESVEEAGRALKASPTMENLIAYKKAIHDFLSQVLNSAYVVQHVRTFTLPRPTGGLGIGPYDRRAPG